ncbi:MAG: DNA repair protein RadC [Desulfobacterales bacterium]
MGDSSDHKGDGHRSRLRDRFLSAGLSGFHDYEVVELLLSLATPRKDCKPAAKEALKQFGSLQRLFEASPRELADVAGIGPKNLLGIKLVKAVADRYLEEKLSEKPVVRNAETLFNYLRHLLQGQSREQFMVLFLDAKNRVLGIKSLFEGTLTATSVYPREIIREALDHRAAALIFAHNHPSGDPTPSPEDARITRRLMAACAVMGIAVHEHLIIGTTGYYSFADQGGMADIRREINHWF